VTLTAIIYACSVGHAAANFQQYDEYGAPLNYPFILTGTPPTDKASSFYYHFYNQHTTER
jgi:arachidonate 5-lipoxygenase